MNQQPYRTLILWTIWASAALVIYLTLYRDTDVWTFVQVDPSRITWLIIGLFLLGVLGSFVVTLMVTKESVRCMHLNAAASQGGLDAITIESEKRAADRFFHSLKSTMERKGEPEVETLLHVELAVYERINHTIEVIGNLLITLGLIGTVMGLTMTLSGLSSSLDSLGHDQEMMLLGLRHAMSGMGTAFYTTLLGAVLGGILLRMFAQLTLHGIEGLHDNLLRICLVYCSPDYAQTLERDVRLLNEELRQLDQNVQMMKQSFAESRQMVTEFREEIKRLGESESGEQGQEPLRVIISRHQEYCEALRQQMHMLAVTNKPWWIRIYELLRPRQ